MSHYVVSVTAEFHACYMLYVPSIQFTHYMYALLITVKNGLAASLCAEVKQHCSADEQNSRC